MKTAFPPALWALAMPVDLDHAPARHPAHPERQVEPQRAGGDDVDGDASPLLAQLHDGPLAELLFDLLDGDLEGLRLLLAGCAAGRGRIHDFSSGGVLGGHSM
jgi:hypothetical protein